MPLKLRPVQEFRWAGVIWLHGLGADGHDFEPIVPELQLACGDPASIRFSACAGAARHAQWWYGDARLVRHPDAGPQRTSG